MQKSVLVLLACAMAGFVGLRIAMSLSAPSLFNDADDVMRLVSVRDLLAGQPFNDTMQHRDNAPFGASMHWSHLLDLPLAGIVTLFASLGRPTAETVMLVTWPSLLLLILVALSVVLARRLAGPGATVPALVLPLLSVPVLTEFAPGRIDHHNVQVLLLMALALALLDAGKSTRAACAAGIIAGTSLAIGMETLPFVIIAIVAVGLFIVFSPETAIRPARWFAAGLAVATAGLWLATTPPADYLLPACDALSLTYVTATTAAAIALLLGTMLATRLSSWPHRFAALALLGALAVALILQLFPQCLRGPYADLDPRFATDMLDFIKEVQPLSERLQQAPATAISLILAPLVGLGAATAFVLRSRGEGRISWLIVCVILLAAIVMTFAQVRGARLAAPLAIAPCAALIAMVFQRLKASGSPAAAFGVFLACLGSASLAHLSIARPLAAMLPAPTQSAFLGRSFSPACLAGASFAPLAALPPARVITQLGLGPRTLLFTPHAIIASGYHRNGEGFADISNFFGTDPIAARAVATRRGLTYALACASSPQTVDFVARIGTDPAWSWLVPISAPADPLQVFHIR